MNLKILAVDDERLALEGLVSAIQKADSTAMVSGFRNANEALTVAQSDAPDVAFLDVEIAASNGLSLSQKLQALYPRVNIIFVTGYKEYLEEAFFLHASGYIMKPVTVDKVRHELSHLRYPLIADKRVRIQTFGMFEVFVDRQPLPFGYAKTKELFACLVDACGSLCSNTQLQDKLWEGDWEQKHKSYFRNLLADLRRVLRERGCEDILVVRRGLLGIRKEAVSCDYYDYLAGVQTFPSFNGEYMSQYSWAEVTVGSLQNKTH